MRGDELGVHRHEAVEGSSGRGEAGSRLRLHDRFERLKCAPRSCLSLRHLRLHSRHRRIVSVSDMWRLEHLNVTHGQHGCSHKRFHVPGVLRSVRWSDRLQGFLNGIRGFACRTKCESLCFEVRVLNGQFKDLAVQLAILGKPGDELLKEADFVGKVQSLKEWPQCIDVGLNGLLGAVGLAQTMDASSVSAITDLLAASAALVK